MNTPLGDLHFHSTNSDGNKTPEERVNQIQLQDPQNQSPWAQTDHDCYSPNFVLPARELGIKAIWATEISAHCDELDLSLHITCYTPGFSQIISDRVATIIEGRKSKVLGQIDRLSTNGFIIDRESFFAWIVSQKMLPESATNYHIAQYIWQHSENRSRTQDLTNGKIQSDNHEKSMLRFMKECLRETGDYASIGFHRSPAYELELRDLTQIAKKEGAILSVAHPNFSFTKTLNTTYGAKNHEDRIRLFEEKIVPILTSLGIKNYEINALASKSWVDTIFRTSERTGGIITFGSDNHGHEEIGVKHGKFGHQNPLLTPEIVKPITEKLLEFV